MKLCSLLYRFFILGIIVFSIIGIQRFCRKQTNGFAAHKIYSQLAYHPDWEVPPLSIEKKEELKAILNQPYLYMTRGAQSYVFMSQDQKYVVKFFRLHRLLPPFWVTDLRWPFNLQHYRLKKIVDRNRALYKDFVSYTIAFNEMQEETGLLFLHLNKTSDLKQKLTLYSALNIAHEVDLDQMEFIVQKKADLIYPSIEQIMKSEGVESAKQRISSLINLLVLRCQKGIHDKDPNLLTNFGFIDTEAKQIDVGRFTLDKQGTTEVDKREILHITDNLHQWLTNHYPPLATHLEQLIDAL